MMVIHSGTTAFPQRFRKFHISFSPFSYGGKHFDHDITLHIPANAHNFVRIRFAMGNTDLAESSTLSAPAGSAFGFFLSRKLAGMEQIPE